MIHKEGYKIIMVTILLLATLNLLMYYFSGIRILNSILLIASLILFLLIIWFFRNPNRKLIPEENTVFSPADGKIVVIEKVYDKEYFNSERIQVSVFMSPLNVHVNYYPISGEIKYVKYYPGKYLVAWHPKSSELNEHSVVVLEKDSTKNVLVKQIAGAVARRIVTYAKTGDIVEQGHELGFIKFGSRVDLLLPLNANIKVKIGDMVQGDITRIAAFQ